MKDKKLFKTLCQIIAVVIILMVCVCVDLKIKRLKAENTALVESNNFKRELIRAYEDCYDADSAHQSWAVIDSLYRSQI